MRIPNRFGGSQHPQARDLPCYARYILDAFQSGNSLVGSWKNRLLFRRHRLIGPIGPANPMDPIFTRLLQAVRPQQFLYFFPLPQMQGSFRPIFGVSLRCAGITSSSSSPFFTFDTSRAGPTFSRRATGPCVWRAGCGARAAGAASGRCAILKGSEARNCSNAIRLVVLRKRFDKTSFLILAINWLNMS